MPAPEPIGPKALLFLPTAHLRLAIAIRDLPPPHNLEIGADRLWTGGGMPNLWYALLFLVGAIIMRGAGCTLNDIADRDYDSRVERTRARPIPSGQVSIASAFLYLILQCLLGLVILLQFNWYSVAVGTSSLIWVAIYPFMKRFTYWPQIFLGIAFNWGALIGWTAIPRTPDRHHRHCRGPPGAHPRRPARGR